MEVPSPQLLCDFMNFSQRLPLPGLSYGTALLPQALAEGGLSAPLTGGAPTAWNEESAGAGRAVGTGPTFRAVGSPRTTQNSATSPPRPPYSAHAQLPLMGVACWPRPLPQLPSLRPPALRAARGRGGMSGPTEERLAQYRAARGAAQPAAPAAGPASAWRWGRSAQVNGEWEGRGLWRVRRGPRGGGAEREGGGGAQEGPAPFRTFGSLTV